MKLLCDAIRAESEYQAVLDACRLGRLDRNPHPMLVTGLYEGAREAFYAAAAADLRALGEEPKPPVLCILPDEKELLKMQTALSDAGLSVLVYPLRDLIFHNVTASREYEHDRIAALCAVQSGSCDAVLTVPDAALQYTIPPDVLTARSFTVEADRSYSLEALTARLLDAGYVRTELVDGVGEFALRGGILDIYPAFGEHPVRIEFWGDDIDQMGIFDPLTQRRIDAAERCFIPPARELLLSSEQKTALRAVIAAQKKKCTSEDGQTVLAQELEVLDGGTEPGFHDKYMTFLYPERTCLFDYFRDRETGILTAPVIVQDTVGISERLKASEFHLREALSSLLEAHTIAPKYAEYTRFAADYDAYIARSSALLCDTFTNSAQGRLSGIFTIRSKQLISYGDSSGTGTDTLFEDIADFRRQNYKILLLAENAIAASALQKQLFDMDIPSVTGDASAALGGLVPGIPMLVSGQDAEGFALSDSRFAVLSTFPGHSAYAKALIRRTKKAKKKQSAAEKILSYADLTVGDYVVHVNHGIGKYLGIETIRDIEGISRDYVKIQYADGGSLFLPCEQLDMISKYIGAHGDDGLVKLNRLGGTDWSKTKAKVRAAAKNMAKELTQLYAARLRKPGYAFAPDDELQRAFESVFPYEETDSQMTAISEIKADMERPHPMDRLLCGDVGYGKTEVALRAAMKAAECGKQTALLVPTTILALQHYQTILSRFRGLPVHAEILSRFRTPKQQEEILRRLRRGEIDILVGTHRLVSRDVQFRDLGLVIIDEEQRFGVAHKEKLKMLAENVDCLTLTATPIPRTLNMAMSGIRDMSVLDEAPGDRVPIQTYVLEYDELILGEALRKELRRGGQIFWLHNRVEDIDLCAARVSQMAPDAAIAVAHGKMDKEEISEIWQRLSAGEIDILISTTIIETGIDIPNANTLVIENADRMGLSQLHQIRGRIGRSARRAYAYFTYPRGRVLTEIASKRLQAIREYTEFGSGFKIAMRDLEIRGAGNILGAEQHGHMETVGYDLYIKILNEAILEEKGEAVPVKVESVLDVSVDAYLPERYVKSGAQRIDLYKKIAAVETEEDRADILDELSDRFGNPPPAAANLVRIAYLRAQASRLHILRIEAKGADSGDTAAPPVRIYPEVFRADAWAKAASVLAAPTASAAPKTPGNRKPSAMPSSPMARAALLARQNAGSTAPGTAPAAKASAVRGPIRLSVSSGSKPCITARLPRSGQLLDAVSQILRVYDAALSDGTPEAPDAGRSL